MKPARPTPEKAIAMDIPVNSPQRYFAVGAIAIIQAERFGAAATRHRTSIRGWVEDEYVIVDAPKHQGTPVRFQARDACSVCFFSGGEACGFDTHVTEASAKTAPYLHLTWPEALKVTRVRQHERIELALPCTIVSSEGDRLQGEISDLSAGGCRFTVRIPVEVDTGVTLSFTLPDGTPIEGLNSVVRSVSTVQTGFTCGCQFADEPSTGRKDIEFFVATRLSQGRDECGHSRPVLVIGSDGPTVNQLRDQLEDLDVPAFSSTNVIDACYRLRMSHPGAVVVNLPQSECTAADVCRWIRDADGFREVPIIVYGAVPASQIERELLEAGASEYLEITGSPRPLVRTIIRNMNSADD